MLSAQGWSVALTVVGALVEVFGISVAVSEIVHRGKLRASEKQVHGRVRATTAAVQASAIGSVYPVVVPTVEDRLKALEEQLAGVPGRIKSTADAAEANARKHADDLIGDVREDHARDVNRLRGLLVGSVSENRRAILGIAALFLGLLLQAAGSVVGALGTSC